MERKRVNVIVREDILEYFDNLASEYGVSRGAMFSFMVAKWKKDEESVQAISDAKELMNYLKDSSEDEGKA